ncbi:MAG: CARDB domain-containing protein, partial [Methanosarcinales archaeon]
VEESNETNNCEVNIVECPGVPDLVINKSVTFVDGMFIVNYTVTNIGCGLAGNSTTCKLVDGELMESQPCPALKSGESYSSSFDPEECPCGETLNVTVCADNDDVVEESNETNNCEVNIVECPSAPSIDVEKTVWNQVTEEWVDELTTLLGETVTFNSTIHNDGECCNLTNLTITDTLSDSFEYVGHYPNITAEVIKNPDGSTTLIWEIPGPLVPCESLTFLINATLIKTGVDTNVQNATAWCGETMVADEDTATVHSVIPEGGIGVSVTPRFNTVNSSVNLSIKIVNTENFDDVFVVSLTNETLPPDW